MKTVLLLSLFGSLGLTALAAKARAELSILKARVAALEVSVKKIL